ncbi:polyketide cyclase/dehydrase/lipid transport protein [Kribbella sp. VKM Ac-2527]|uniref:Polyketide cyclase/dehydrase/lipid transport protein n=1 Tax=Kribbella caucasensis TaxID=2512215 RepID=A0A4R6KPW2_9ACTN|nr:SRPBCC family protein [Kribbella sp. VKM Ac-2527]TDO54725.1 polyketide cyclase/dehydrase/lipid transport protein [Kribbella sp. VKM Ac-2527]
MADVVESVAIDRAPEDVAAYVEDLARHGEWQAAIVEVEMLTEGPIQVGTRGIETRRVGPGMTVKAPYQIVEYEPGKSFRFQVTTGPVRPDGTLRVEPSGTGTRVTLELDFVGRGVGRLFALIARRQAAKDSPANLQALKHRLESG